MIMNCIHCNTECNIPKYRMLTFKYCSRACSMAHKTLTERVIKECSICSAEFSVSKLRDPTAKYCSQKCYHKAMNGRGSVELECTVCSKKFNRPPSRSAYTFPVCDKICRGLLMRKPRAASGESVRKWLQRRSLIIECNRCKFSKNVEILVVHHIDRNRKNNDFANLEVLCPNCHALEHYSKD